jgi:Flp pilus assembly pilin Flp
MNGGCRRRAVFDPTRNACHVIRAVLADETAQDVIEYALLGAIVGVASILTWQLLAATVGEVYGAADSGVQGVSACTPNPGGGGC